MNARRFFRSFATFSRRKRPNEANDNYTTAGKGVKDWNFESLKRIYHEIGAIAEKELTLDLYPNQIEIITFEQMLDAYSSIGMPLMYQHWSFGKNFARDELLYRHGLRNLAYEIVINSNPCISYLMEENSMMMQTLVIAHAAFGHNHFFKNNNLFRQWTDANGILSYLEFAKSYIASCESRYGEAAGRARSGCRPCFMAQGVNRYPSARASIGAMRNARRGNGSRNRNAPTMNSGSTVPASTKTTNDPRSTRKADAARPSGRKYSVFSGKEGPPAQALGARDPQDRPACRAVFLSAEADQDDERRMRDVRSLLHHESSAPDRPFDRRRDDGFLQSHTAAVFQPDFDHPGYYGINPYALGFGLMQDIQARLRTSDR